MATPDTVDILDMLERDYKPNKLISLALQNAPLTAWLPKSEEGQGEICVMRFHTSFAGGSGANVTDAIAAEVADGYQKALVDWKLLYTASSMTNPAIQRSKGSKQLVDAWQQAIKGSMARHGNELETLMFGAGYGILGRRASASTNVITLTLPGEAFNFQKGQVVGASANADGSSPRTGTTSVASIDYSNNKITLVSAAGITSFADNDYFFVKGVVGTTAVPGGLARLFPPVAPTAGDNFGGLDRSTAPEQLAGWRYTGIAGDQVTEQIIKGLQFGSKFDGKPDTVFISVEKMTTLILEQANRVEYTSMKSEKYNVNFRGVVLQGPNGEVTVMSSAKCPDANGWALERDSLKLESVQEPLIAVATRTGKYIDSELNDLVRLRWRSQFQLECSLPGHNGVFNFV
jgi:hypothetical protein